MPYQESISNWKKGVYNMKKRISRAFGKDVYLLGKNVYGELVWLESPSWDCGWYWGFGYVEIYNYGGNRDPSKCTDISSHSHFDGLVFHNNNKGEYIHHINKALPETTLTDNEAWELSDLMKRFYTLRESAEIFHRGNANYTSNTKHDSTNKELAEYINNVELPKIFNRVIEILSPKTE
jgi:hypothetical protein